MKKYSVVEPLGDPPGPVGPDGPTGEIIEFEAPDLPEAPVLTIVPEPAVFQTVTGAQAANLIVASIYKQKTAFNAQCDEAITRINGLRETVNSRLEFAAKISTDSGACLDIARGGIDALVGVISKLADGKPPGDAA